jgi:hypothetical protein
MINTMVIFLTLYFILRFISSYIIVCIFTFLISFDVINNHILARQTTNYVFVLTVIVTNDRLSIYIYIL